MLGWGRGAANSGYLKNVPHLPHHPVSYCLLPSPLLSLRLPWWVTPAQMPHMGALPWEELKVVKKVYSI